MNCGSVSYLSSIDCKPYGFSLAELIITIALVTLLVGLALPNMLRTHQQAQYASINALSGSLAAAVHLLHSQWIVNGHSRAVNGVKGFGNNDIATNSMGWPEDAGRKNSFSDTSKGIDVVGCTRLWVALLQSDSIELGIHIFKKSPENFTGELTGSNNFDFSVSSQGSSCLYHYKESSTHSYIEYNTSNGDVITTL